jgi:hypothetical protein
MEPRTQRPTAIPAWRNSEEQTTQPTINNMKRTFHTLILAALFWGAGLAQAAAQLRVDVGLYRTGTDLEVRLRPTEDFQEILSAVVFTLRWDRNSDAYPTDVLQKSAPAVYIPIAQAGKVVAAGNHNYQSYAGFGFDLLAATGEPWRAGQEYTVARIPVLGRGGFALVNDDWTAERENNGDFYVELNGLDHSGIIYKGMDDVALAASSATVMPNPNLGQFTFLWEVDSESTITVELFNTLGQVVYTDSRNGFEGTYRRDMDVRGMGAGAYQLRVTRNGLAETHKIIVQ